MTNTQWKSDLYRRGADAYWIARAEGNENAALSKAFDIIVAEAEVFVYDVMAENEKLRMKTTEDELTAALVTAIEDDLHE